MSIFEKRFALILEIFWQAGDRVKGGVLCRRSEPLTRCSACRINPDQGEALSLAELHAAARLYVNFFQPSFKLKAKTRIGSKICKQYYPPATPAERLIDNNRVSTAQKQRLRTMFAELDPVQLLYRIREAQRLLTLLDISSQSQVRSAPRPDRKTFVSGLSTAWRKGEIRLTHRKSDQKRRGRTRPDPFESVWPTVKQWLERDPNACAKDLFIRLQTEFTDWFTRRVKQWRQDIAFQLVFSGTETAAGGWTWLAEQNSPDHAGVTGEGNVCFSRDGEIYRC